MRDRQDLPRAQLEPPPPVPVYFRYLALSNLERVGLRVVRTYVGSFRIWAAVPNGSGTLQDYFLLTALNEAQQMSTSSSEGTVPVAIIPLKTIQEMQQEGDALYAQEQPARANVAHTLLPPISHETGVVVDTGASVNLYKSTDGLVGYVRARTRPLSIQSASGHTISSDEVGSVPGLGVVAITSAVSDNLLSVIQLCRNSLEATVTFQGNEGTISHPNLPEALVVRQVDEQYTLSQVDFVALQAALAGESRHARAFTASVNVHPDRTATVLNMDSLSLSANSADVTDGAEQTETQNEDAGPEDPFEAAIRAQGDGTRQVLHDTRPAVRLTPEQMSRAREVRQLHMCLGHPSDKVLSDSLTNSVIVGTHLTARDVSNARAALGPCVACVVAKTHHHSHPTSLSDPCVRVGEKVYMDLLPMSKEDGTNDVQVGGYSNMIISVDSYSNFVHVIPACNKKTSELISSMQIILADYTRYGHKVSEVVTDSEVCLTALNTFLGEQGIILSQTQPYLHNRRVERQVQTMYERARALRANSQVLFPDQLTGQLYDAAVYFMNDVSNTKFTTQSPRILFQGVKADMLKRTLLPVGTVVMVPTPENKQQRASMGVTLGPSHLTYGANKYYLISTQRVVKSKDVIVQEYIPDDFPWPVKTGRHQFTAIKRKKGRKSNRKSATNNVTVNSGASQQTRLERVPEASIQLTPAREGGNVVPPPMPLASQPRMVETPVVPQAEVRSEAQLSTEAAQNEALRKYLLAQKDKEKQTKEVNTDEIQVLMNALLEARDNQKTNEFRTNIAEARVRTPENGYDLPATRKSNRKQTATVGGKPNATSQPKKGGKLRKLRTTPSDQSVYEPVRPTQAPVSETPGMRHSDRQALNRMRRNVAKAARRIQKAYKISVKQGLEGEYAQESKEAILGEIQNMLQYRVGHYIRQADIPKDKLGNILQSFMFLKHKTLPDGSYDKTKARMVGNGATQKSHMYDMVSSSTVALASVFMLCNIASHLRAKITTYDIKGAFLHAEFSDEDEVTYIRINKEITALWIEQDPSAAPFVDGRGTLLLELDKFIYGLKQSPLKFQQHLRLALIKLGYTQTGQDECIYMKRDDSDHYSILSTHVDDILQVATHEEFYTELKEGLVKEYGDITTSEEGSAYLGMTIERDPSDRRIVKMSQKGLIDKILERYPKADGDRHKYFSPSGDNLFTTARDTGATTATEVQRREFLSVLMTLMYCARLTRPDILMPVTFLASRAHCATTQDIEHLLRIVRYLGETRDLCMHLNCDSLQVRCKCDAAFASHSPEDSCYGHTGYIIGMGSNNSYVHGRSGKQKVASTSSTDAEIIAMCEALKTCYWLRELMRELKFPLQEILLYQDNLSAMTLATEPTTPKRSKHLLTKLTYVRSLVRSGAVRMEHLSTEKMTADVLSKPLHGDPYYMHTGDMMGLQWSKDKYPFPSRKRKLAAEESNQDSGATANQVVVLRRKRRRDFRNQDQTKT